MVRDSPSHSTAQPDPATVIRHALRLLRLHAAQIAEDVTTVRDALREFASQHGGPLDDDMSDLDLRAGGLLRTTRMAQRDEDTTGLKPAAVLAALKARVEAEYARLDASNRQISIFTNQFGNIPMGDGTVLEALAEKVPSSPALIRATRSFRALREATDLRDGMSLGGTFFGATAGSDVARGLVAGGDFGHVVMHHETSAIIADVIDTVHSWALAREYVDLFEQLARVEPEFRSAKDEGWGPVGASAEEAFETRVVPFDEVLHLPHGAWIGGQYAQLIHEARLGRQRAIAALDTLPDSTHTGMAAHRARQVMESMEELLESALGVGPGAVVDERAIRCRKAFVDAVVADRVKLSTLYSLLMDERHYKPIGDFISSDPRGRDYLRRIDELRISRSKLYPSEATEWQERQEQLSAPYSERPGGLKELADRRKEEVSSGERALYPPDEQRIVGLSQALTILAARNGVFREALKIEEKVLSDSDSAAIVRHIMQRALDGKPLQSFSVESIDVEERNVPVGSSGMILDARAILARGPMSKDHDAMAADIAAHNAFEASRMQGRMTAVARVRSQFEAALLEMFERDPEGAAALELIDEINSGGLSPQSVNAFGDSVICPPLVVHATRAGKQVPGELLSHFDVGQLKKWPGMRAALNKLSSITAEADGATSEHRRMLIGVLRVLQRVDGEGVGEPRRGLWPRSGGTRITVGEWLRRVEAERPQVAAARAAATRLAADDTEIGAAATVDEADPDTSVSSPNAVDGEPAPLPSDVVATTSAALDRERSARTHAATLGRTIDILVHYGPDALRLGIRRSVEEDRSASHILTERTRVANVNDDGSLTAGDEAPPVRRAAPRRRAGVRSALRLGSNQGPPKDGVERDTAESGAPAPSLLARSADTSSDAPALDDHAAAVDPLIDPASDVGNLGGVESDDPPPPGMAL